MATTHKPPLTSAEIGILWNQYILDTLSLCVEKYALVCEQDEQIRSIIRDSLVMLEKSSTQVRQIFQNDGIPLPIGYTDNDVNLEAPPLYSSIFRLQYLKYKVNLRMALNGRCMAWCSRSDVRDLFHYLSIATLSLDDQATNLLLDKGLYIRPPYISVPDHIEFVQHHNFMGQFFGGSERKLLAIEIAGLSANIQNNLLGKALAHWF